MFNAKQPNINWRYPTINMLFIAMKVQKFDRLKFIATLNTIKKYPVGESDEGGIESMIHTDEENFTYELKTW